MLLVCCINEGVGHGVDKNSSPLAGFHFLAGVSVLCDESEGA